jgi:hypothetical protein
VIAIEVVRGRAHWHWRIVDVSLASTPIFCEGSTLHPDRLSAQNSGDGFLAQIDRPRTQPYETVQQDRVYRSRIEIV